MSGTALRPKKIMEGGRGGTVVIFDDGSTFDYLHEIDTPKINFVLCRTFPDLINYMAQLERREVSAPDILAIDVFCDTHLSFEAFGSALALDQNQCGYQLYEHILRPFGHRFDERPVIFFTSLPSNVRELAAVRLANATGVKIMSAGRSEFLRKLFALCVDEGLLTTDEIPITEPLTQPEYARLFAVLAEEFEFSESERCSFFGLTLSDTNKIDSLLDMTTMGNERIDVLFAISLLLDTFVREGDKRDFLTRCERIENHRLIDLVLSGSVGELLRVKYELEFRVGGGIL